MQNAKRFEQVQRDAVFKMRSKYHSQTLTTEVAEQQKRAENNRSDIKRLSAQLVDLRNSHYRCGINRQRLLRSKRGSSSHGVQEIELQMNEIRRKARKIADVFPTYSIDQDSSFYVSLRLLRVASYFRGDFLTRPPIATRLALQHHLQHTYMMEANHAASFTAVLPFLSLRYTGKVVADPTAIARADDHNDSGSSGGYSSSSSTAAMGGSVEGVVGAPKQLAKRASRRSNLGENEDEPEEAILADGDEMLDDSNFKATDVATGAGGGAGVQNTAWQMDGDILPPKPQTTRVSPHSFAEIIAPSATQQPLLVNLDAALKILAPRLKQLCPEYTPRETMGIAVALARAEDPNIALSSCGVTITSPLIKEEALTAGDALKRLEAARMAKEEALLKEAEDEGGADDVESISAIKISPSPISSFHSGIGGGDSDALFNAELADAGIHLSPSSTAGASSSAVSTSFGGNSTLDAALTSSLLNALSEATIVCHDHRDGAIMSRFVYSLSKVSPQIGASHLYAIRHRLSTVVYSMGVADLVQLCRGIAKTRSCDRSLMNDISRRALDLLGEMSPLHIADILHTLHLTNTRHSVLLKRAAARQLILVAEQDLVTVSLTLAALSHFGMFEVPEVYTGLVNRVLGADSDAMTFARRVSPESAAAAVAESPITFASISLALAKAGIMVPDLFAVPLGLLSKDEGLFNPDASPSEIRSSLQILTTILWSCSVFKVGVVGVSVASHQDISVTRLVNATCSYLDMILAPTTTSPEGEKNKRRGGGALNDRQKQALVSWMCTKSSTQKMLSEITTAYTSEVGSNDSSSKKAVPLTAAVGQLSSLLMSLQAVSS